MVDTELEQANVSQHLAILRNQGLVESRRDGPRIMYRIKRPEVAEILVLVNGSRRSVPGRQHDVPGLLGIGFPRNLRTAPGANGGRWLRTGAARRRVCRRLRG